MKKTDKFVWTDQADEAFKELKRTLSTAPVLAAPIEKEPMLLYIAATTRVISIVMVVERPEKDKAQPVQRPVYLSMKCSQPPSKTTPTTRRCAMTCTWRQRD